MKGWVWRRSPVSFTGLGTAEHMHSLSLVRWSRKELSNPKDIPWTRTNMHKLTMAIRRFLPIKRKTFWRKCPNKVGNSEERRDDKEERAYFWIAQSVYEKDWELGSLQKQKTSTQQPKKSFSILGFLSSFPNQNWWGLILKEKQSVLSLYLPVQTHKLKCMSPLSHAPARTIRKECNLLCGP